MSPAHGGRAFLFHPLTASSCHLPPCDWQSERLCYAGGMGAITFERSGAVLVVLGVLLVGGGVYLVAGLPGVLMFAGAVCLVLGSWLALDADNGSGG